ncbi:MAG TPA: tetratricopeptide repeat protein [Acidobacteriota bacterium]|nr:tetratricopeptide repeat protein [Acidobacteriota bacterium]
MTSNPQFAIRNPQFFAVLCVLFSSVVLAQTTSAPYTIFGRVSLPNGAPASRVTVKVDRQGGVGRQALTDDSGRFEIGDLPRGRYFVTAENPADPNQFTDPVEAETGRMPGTRIQANVYLKYRSKVTQPKEAEGGAVTVAEERQQVPKAARKSFDQAIRQRNEKQFEKALKSFDRSIEEFPDYFQAFAERGHLRIAMGNAAEALKDFDQALKINPGYASALRGAGLCEYQQGRFAEATQHLEKAADAEPGNATTYLFWGVSSLALNRLDQAHAALTKALTIDPNGAARAHVYLANLSIKEDKPQEAIAEIEAYLTAVPNAPDADKLRALLDQLKTK